MVCVVCQHERKPYHPKAVDSSTDYCACNPEDGEEKDLYAFEDLLGNTVEVGDIIATALIAGRSANLAIFGVERIYAKASGYGTCRWSPRLRVVPMGRTYGTVGDLNLPPEDRKRSTLQFWDRSVLLEKRGNHRG